MRAAKERRCAPVRDAQVAGAGIRRAHPREADYYADARIGSNYVWKRARAIKMHRRPPRGEPRSASCALIAALWPAERDRSAAIKPLNERATLIETPDWAVV